MYTPEGQPANKMDRTMLLAMWAKHLQSQPLQNNFKMYFAGIGKPTLPLNKHTQEFLANYWTNYTGEAINYEHPQGCTQARKTMAEAMSNWYQTEVTEKNILFNVGGAGALKAIFLSLQQYHESSNEFRIITPAPYYTLYADSSATLHCIDVMSHPGYRLTSFSLKENLNLAYELAKVDGKCPKALLLCNPNNPLGTAFTKEELIAFADVLRLFPDLYIVLDEAYAEMVFDSAPVSLLSVAPDLKPRMIIMRSATKGLSAAGERMAITIAFNPSIMTKLTQQNIAHCGHAPISLQLAYAETMKHFQEEDRQKIVDFYLPRMEYVHQRIINMGANLTENTKRPDGTFYAIADFSDILGEPLIREAKAALGEKEVISSDEDIVYSLLFQNSVMVAPLSYFGLPSTKGFIRITCSESLDDLEDLLNRLEARLFRARVEKNKKLRWQLEETFISLIEFNMNKHKGLLNKIPPLNDEISCLQLKMQNDVLNNALFEARNIFFEAAKIIKYKPSEISYQIDTHIEHDEVRLIN